MRGIVPSLVRVSLSMLVIVAWPPGAPAEEKPESKAAAQTAAAPAPYVDSAAIKQRFGTVSAADMDALRSKRILFASRSFGLNLYRGLAALAKRDDRYDLLGSYERYDVFKAGGDLSVIPARAFENRQFVHFLATYWPHTTRVVEMDTLLRKPPHEFAKLADFAIIFFHTALPENFEQYADTMDALQRDFPRLRCIYVTAGFMAAEKAKENEAAHAWSEKVRARYQGRAPLYDLGKILSDDFRTGHAFAPEYSSDSAGVHPSAPAGEEMMAKGFLLVLRDALRWDPAGSTAPEPVVVTRRGPTAEKLPPQSADYRAVRAILDANGLAKKDVDAVSVVAHGRVVQLHLQEGGITKLPDEIGVLTELRVLHVYGDPALSHPLLEQISPALAKCTKLEELLVNDNDLRALPAELAKLTGLTSLSVAGNRLANLPTAVQAWVERFDAEGLSRQRR